MSTPVPGVARRQMACRRGRFELVDEASTRVITHSRGAYDRMALGLMLKIFWRPLGFGMQRPQLLNLKRLVEAGRRGR